MKMAKYDVRIENEDIEAVIFGDGLEVAFSYSDHISINDIENDMSLDINISDAPNLIKALHKILEVHRGG
jgi:hypothetical protein